MGPKHAHKRLFYFLLCDNRTRQLHATRQLLGHLINPYKMTNIITAMFGSILVHYWIVWPGLKNKFSLFITINSTHIFGLKACSFLYKIIKAIILNESCHFRVIKLRIEITSITVFSHEFKLLSINLNIPLLNSNGLVVCTLVVTNTFSF